MSQVWISQVTPRTHLVRAWIRGTQRNFQFQENDHRQKGHQVICLMIYCYNYLTDNVSVLDLVPDTATQSGDVMDTGKPEEVKVSGQRPQTSGTSGNVLNESLL